MKITDETLSAFLDSELTPTEMDAVREQLATDPSLADRLAELAVVDSELQSHYGEIDDRPLPASINRMLAKDHEETTEQTDNNIVPFPWWRRLREHSGKAIAAAVVAGFAMTQWLTMPSGDNPAWPAVAGLLDSRASGETYSVSEDIKLTPRLTFRNHSGEWCRQFRLQSDSDASEQIACRTQSGAWEQRVQVETGQPVAADGYRTASGGSVLDDELNQMMSTPPLGLEKERTLLEQQWRVQ
jgi:anti-sigma factor RsiW